MDAESPIECSEFIQENSSQQTVARTHQTCANEPENESADHLQTSPMDPITPECDTEINTSIADFCSPPTSDSTISTDDPISPLDWKLDPFAHGPETLAWVPLHDKCMNDEFGTVIAETAEAEIAESSNGICREKILEVLVENYILSPRHLESPTPSLSIFKEGYSPTCPGAPMRPKVPCKLLKNIYVGFCRKLEF